MIINNKTHKYFNFNDIFAFKRGTRFTEEEHVSGDIAYISSTKNNNGIFSYVTPPEKTKKGNKLVVYNNCLTLSNSGSVCYLFYHNYDFVASDHVTVIWIKKRPLTLKIALYLKAIFEKMKYKHNFGREISNYRLKNEKILLPVDKNDNPDWQYMENYIKSLKSQIRFEPICTKNKNVEKININNWKEFPITSIFNVHGSKTTQKLKLEEYGAGEYPYITTQATNNGVAGFYDFWTENKNVLTIDSAVIGFCSYQDKEFSASDHVEILEPLKDTILNKYTAMFLKTIISCSQYKYAYGRKFNQDRIKETVLLLPAKLNSKKEYEPDWEYMEDYIKSLPYGDLI